MCVAGYVLKTFCSLVGSSVSTSVDSIEIFDNLVGYNNVLNEKMRNDVWKRSSGAINDEKLLEQGNQMYDERQGLNIL